MNRNWKRLSLKGLMMVLLFLICDQAVSAEKSTKEIKKYLQKQIRQDSFICVDKKEQSILNAEVLKADINFHLGGGSSSGITRAWFLKSKGLLRQFYSEDDLISSAEFLKAINSNFRLKTDEDEEAFCNLLHKINNNFRGKVFKEKNKLCFVSDEFFDDVSYYEVSIKKTGEITGIKNLKKKMELPENTKSYSLNYLEQNIAKLEDAKLMRKALKKGLPKLSFKLVRVNLKKLKNIKLYNAGFTVTYKDEYGSSSSITEFALLKNKNKYEIIENIDNLFEHKDFKRAVIASYSIQTKNKAKEFEKMLDSIEPADSFNKKHFKKGGVWCFIRNESFGDLTGFLVTVDATGKILNIEKSKKIDDAGIAEAESTAKNLPLDFEFTLVKPSSTEVTVKAGEEIPVEISFNADAVRAKNAYILTIVDGFQEGMLVDSNMQSPFTDKIPTDYLASKYGNLDYMINEYGKGVHIVDYVLVVGGEPFETIKIKVTIK